MQTKQSSLALEDRMRHYEAISNPSLVRRVPVIVRIDGRAFHGVTSKNFKCGEYDHNFIRVMTWVMQLVAEDIQGCKFAYTQSDEISFLLTDYTTIRTEAHFGYKISKLNSVTASLAASAFTRLTGGIQVSFDARSFSLPQDEVCNYFIWRQQDATRNAIQMAGQEYFSHKELHKKSCSDIQDMLFKQWGVNFNDYPAARKRGVCFSDGALDEEIPIFSQHREYVERFVNVRED